MGTGASQAESSGRSTGSAGAPVSRHVGAAGKGSGGLIGSERAQRKGKKQSQNPHASKIEACGTRQLPKNSRLRPLVGEDRTEGFEITETCWLKSFKLLLRH